MNLLGMDTSTAATSVCVLRSDGRVFESSAAPPVTRPSHSRDLLPAIAEQMAAAGVGFAELDSIAVAVGPGGYTGLRIGIATARALAQAHGLPVRPVGTLAALAAGLEAPLSLPLLDGRRGEVFAALYADGEQLWTPFAASPEEVVRRLAQAEAPDRPAPLAAGDGAVRFRDVMEVAADVPPDDSPLHAVRALEVCRLAAAAPATAPEAVLPEYLRAPDATPRPR
jgi:tRNA threonylcarbamoyladenosine biosynthesis protein TsaB